MIDNIARIVTRKPGLIIIISLLLLLPSLIGYVSTPVNYDLLSYLPGDLESTQGEKLLEDPFKAAATSMLVVENMPAAYSQDLVDKIEDVPGVSGAVGLRSIIGAQVPLGLLPHQYTDKLETGKASLIIIQYSRPPSSEVTMNAIQTIQDMTNKQCFVAGFSVFIKDIRDLLDEQMPIYILVAVVLALAAMLLTLESTALPFAFIACIGLAIAYNMGSNLFIGEISFITKALAAILQLAVTMDYSIFLYQRYAEVRNQFEDKRDAMAIAVKAAFQSLGGSSLTTVAGFLAMCFMQFALGMNLGLIMAKGVVLGVLTVIFVLPSFLLVADKQIEKRRHRSLMPNTSKMNRLVLHHKALFLLLFVIAVVPAYYSQTHAAQYYKLADALPEDTDVRLGSAALEESFHTSTFHIVLVSDQVKDIDMNEMEDRLENLDGVTSLISSHSLMGNGIPDFFIPDRITDMMKGGGYQLIMINSEYDVASDNIEKQLGEIREIVKEYDPDSYITGEAAMTEDLINTMADDFKKTNYITLLFIFLIIMYVFRSVTVPLVLIANIELAIFINEGIGYWTNTEIPFIAPTMIGCIQMGATIDYAILLTTRFREEIQNGHDRLEAAHIAATTSDASIITSALVMFLATLGVGFVSTIDLISSICMMLARGAVISSFICMFMLPAMLYLFEPIFRHTSLNWASPKPPKEPKAGNAGGTSLFSRLPKFSKKSAPAEISDSGLTEISTSSDLPETPEKDISGVQEQKTE